MFTNNHTSRSHILQVGMKMMALGETFLITLITGMLGHVSEINTQSIYIYFAQLRHQENEIVYLIA